MTVLVDSCVLLDLATEDPRWLDWSIGQITTLLRGGERLAINPLIFAEVSAGYDDPATAGNALPPYIYRREHLPFEAAFRAGQSFLTYRRRGGERRSPLPDFYIGAHAEVRGHRLLTRDPRRFRTYFPRVELIAP